MLAMWRVTRTIAAVMLLSLVVSAGVAYAQYNYQYPTTPQPASPPSHPTSGTGNVVNVAMATVHGKQEQILTNARGMTLYYFTGDTPMRSACTGGCAKMWPPLLSTAMPTHPATLSGTFRIVRDANGSQVSYNGHLLYAYSGDTARGQAAGDGLYGKWFAAKPGLTAAAGTSGSIDGNTGTGW
jgi:predicted lipoprotein with Yx(FWY)xxD motif